jgi:uncharacterized protein
MMKKTILITGASSGIGKSIAEQLAGEGHDLVVVARRKTNLMALKTDLEARHHVSITVEARDLADANEAHELVRLYAPHVDILINNAALGWDSYLTDMEAEKWEQLIAVNVTALTILTHGFAKEMKKRQQGEILLIGSGGGYIPYELAAVYHATKAFVNNFGASIRFEMEKHGVFVGVFMPGFVDTDYYRFDPSATAKAKKLFLLSPDSTARHAIKALRKHQPVAYDDLSIRIHNTLIRFMPARLANWTHKKLIEFTRNVKKLN